MTSAEFQRLAAALTELFDYLIAQHHMALSVGHPADAAVMQECLRRVGRASAELHALMSESLTDRHVVRDRPYSGDV